MHCHLCNSTHHKKREGSVRDNKNLAILECLNCGLVCLSDIQDNNETFYENSKMHQTFDFDKWRAQTQEDDSRRFTFVKSMIANKTLMDFGSGNGGFLKKASELCTSVYGVELEKAVRPYYAKEKIALFHHVKDVDVKVDVITAFHVLEHLNNPIDTLSELSFSLEKNGKMIIEVPNANDALLSIYKSESFSHFTYWSCHLYLYTEHTLKILAKKANLKVDFIKHIQRYPLSNHLYWLSQNKPGGHMQWGNFIDSVELSQAYENQLASLGATDTIIMQLSKEE